jgi:hypothetical protein
MPSMNTSNKSKKVASRTPLTLVVVAILVVGVAIAGILLLNKTSGNYAEETAKPLEQALISRGATKQCSKGDAGKLYDNIRPTYYAIFELPGNDERATELLFAAAKDSGYSLTYGKQAPNPEDGKLYRDETSKKSPYSDLKEGNIQLLADVHSNKTYYGLGDNPCTITERDNPPADKTTVWITINLPEHKK